MNSKLLKICALLFALALVASACGSDDTEDVVEAASDAVDDAEEAVEEAVDDAEEAVEEAMDDAEDVGGAADEDAASAAVEEAMEEEVVVEEVVEDETIADLEAQWAANRQVIIDEIKAAGYGVEDGVLTGPAGFSIDLSECPADWSDTGGIEDGVVTLGNTIAQSGTLAAFGSIAIGMDAYFQYVNETGGIGPDGLQLELIIKDDAYVATQTQELVAELLQTENPFFITTLGSPNTFSVQGTLNQNCIPQPFVMTGHQAWGDPVNNPWTTGMQMSYATEALLWGAWIEANLADQAPVSVGALVMDNDFGLAYEQGFARFAEASDIIGDVEFVRHDPAAATLTNEVTTLAAGDPDVFISMTSGNPCVLATQEVGRSGLHESADAYFISSTCKAVSAYMEPAGEAADGWLIFGGGTKDSTDPQYDDDPYISWVNEQIEAAGLDSGVSLNATGYAGFGWPHIEALRIAAELDGGLSRTNYMLAIRSMRLDAPGLIAGIKFGAYGNDDAYFVEGSDLSRFDYENQSWVQEGGIIDLDGQSPNCPWVAGEGC